MPLSKTSSTPGGAGVTKVSPSSQNKSLLANNNKGKDDSSGESSTENTSPVKEHIETTTKTKLDKKIFKTRVPDEKTLKDFIQNTERPSSEQATANSSGSSAQPAQSSQQQNQNSNQNPYTPQSNFGHTNPSSGNCCNHNNYHNHANECWASRGGQNHDYHPNKDPGHSEPKDPVQVAENENQQSQEDIEAQAQDLKSEPPRIEDSVPSNQPQEMMS